MKENGIKGLVLFASIRNDLVLIPNTINIPKQDHREANVTRPLIPFFLILGQIKGKRCSIFRTFEIFDSFHCPRFDTGTIYSLLRFYCESYHNNFFWRIEMWVSFISPPNLSRNRWTDRQTHTHMHTQTESDTLPI